MKSLLCCFMRRSEEEAEVMTSSSSHKEQEELRDNPVVVDRLPSLPLPPLRSFQPNPSPRMLGELQAFKFTEATVSGGHGDGLAAPPHSLRLVSVDLNSPGSDSRYLSCLKKVAPYHSPKGPASLPNSQGPEPAQGQGELENRMFFAEVEEVVARMPGEPQETAVKAVLQTVPSPPEDFSFALLRTKISLHLAGVFPTQRSAVGKPQHLPQPVYEGAALLNSQKEAPREAPYFLLHRPLSTPALARHPTAPKPGQRSERPASPGVQQDTLDPSPDLGASRHSDGKLEPRYLDSPPDLAIFSPPELILSQGQEEDGTPVTSPVSSLSSPLLHLTVYPGSLTSLHSPLLPLTPLPPPVSKTALTKRMWA